MLRPRVFASVFGLLLVVAAGSLARGNGREGRSSMLSPPDAAPFPNAVGLVELGGEAFVLKVKGLGAGTYSVHLDDGTGVLQPIGEVAVEPEDGDDGKGNDEGEDDGKDGAGGNDQDGEPGDETGDDGKGDDGPRTDGSLRLVGGSLPFGVASPLDLGGRAIEVKNAESVVVLSGKTPAPIVDEPKEHVGECPLTAPAGAPQALDQPGDQPIGGGDGDDATARGSLRLEQGETRIVIKVSVHGLIPETVYSLVLTNPEGGATETLGMLTTNGEGGGKFKLDSANGDAIPFGASSLAALVGFTAEVKDPEGKTVLSGAVCPAKPRDGDDDKPEDPPGADEECEANLSRPEGAPDADATGEVEIEGEELEVEVERLAAGTYDVFLIDPAEGGAAVKIGQVAPKEEKEGHAELEYKLEEGGTLAFGKTSMAEFVGFRIEIRNAEGNVVLGGNLPATACKAEDEDRPKEDGGDDGKDGDGDDAQGDGKGAGVVPDIEPMFVMVGAFDTPFLRGDSNRDAVLNLTDAVQVLLYLFSGGAKPYCLDSADATDDGLVDIADPITVLRFLYLGGPGLADPGIHIAGSDSTADALYCEE